MRNGLKDQEQNIACTKKDCIDPSKKRGEDGEDTKKKSCGMCGRELCVTRGDLMMFNGNQN